jgi:cytochrome c556
MRGKIVNLSLFRNGLAHHTSSRQLFSNADMETDMPRPVLPLRPRIAVIVTALILTAGAAAAHEGATGIVAQRMDLMKQMGQHMKELGHMLAGKTPFDPEAAERLAQTMHEHCAHVRHMFPPGSDGHHTEATAAVWTNRTEFDARMRRFDVAVEELVTAAASGEKAQLAAEFKAVGQECSGCHDNFRQKK